MNRVTTVLIAVLLLLISGCSMAPREEAPPALVEVVREPDEVERVSLHDALSIAGSPVYLIIGRDCMPDASAGSWTIISGDPVSGYNVVFIRGGDVVFTDWPGSLPGEPIDPLLFPVPSEPTPLVIYPEVQDDG